MQQWPGTAQSGDVANRPTRRRRRQGWLSTAILIGGLAVIGLALLTVPGWIAPSPTPEAQSPSASPSAAVSFPPSAFRSIEWQVTALGAGSEGALVTGLVVADGRLVAVGSREGEPLAWWSDDAGTTWTAATTMIAPEPAPSARAVAAPRTVAASGRRVVAAGFWIDPDTSAILGPVVWVSPDGQTWQAHDLSPAMPAATLDTIVGTDDGFYAIGHASVSQALAWWRSADGVSWLPLNVGGLPILAAAWPAVAVRPDLILVASGSGGRAAHPGIWVADLTLFQFEEVLHEEEKAGFLTAVAQADYGFVAVGQTMDDPEDPTLSRLAAWISSDGRSWQQLTFEAAAGTSAGAIAANSTGAAIIGWSETAQAPEAWFLPGGAGSPSTVQLPVIPRDIVALPDRFVAIGWCPPELSCPGPMVGVGRPSEAAEAPAPTLPPRP